MSELSGTEFFCMISCIFALFQRGQNIETRHLLKSKGSPASPVGLLKKITRASVMSDYTGSGDSDGERHLLGTAIRTLWTHTPVCTTCKHFWKVGAQKQASLKVLKSGGPEPRSLIGVYAYGRVITISMDNIKRPSRLAVGYRKHVTFCARLLCILATPCFITRSGVTAIGRYC